ncbi:unnamed protein product [Parnassius mnemosyne]|uniref:CCHC-type domain-containing protein n=1 Tax=Parnassius mnemosyne TaxID=213953 RepID=A0AAV1M4E4_9NEOP
MSNKSTKSCIELAKSKPPSRTIRGVSPVSAPTLRKKVLLQNATSTQKTTSSAADTESSQRAMTETSRSKNPDNLHCTIIAKEHVEQENITARNPHQHDTASENNTSITMDMEAELDMLGICKPVLRTDDDWSDSDSVASGGSRRSSILPPAYKRAGISMDLATQRANEFLLSGKEALEKAGKMKRECKQEVHDCLQGLYETVLSLSDSRSRHRLALEQERSRAAKELVRVERAHNKQISDLQSLQLQKFRDIQQVIQETQKSVESIRGWLNYEMDDPIKAIYQIRQDISGISNRSTNETPNYTTVNRETLPIENTMVFTNQIREVIEQIKVLSRNIGDLRDKMADKESIKSITLAMDELKEPQIDPNVNNIKVIKNMIQELQTRPQCSKSSQVISADDILTAVEPLTLKVDKLSNEIRELKESGTSQWAYQNNSGLGTELAIAEIKENLEHLEACNNSSMMMNKTTDNLNYHASKEQQAAGPKRSYAEVFTNPTFSLVIESSDPRHTSEDVVSAIKTNVDVVQLGVGVNKVRRARNQKVVITCDTDEDRNTLQRAIKNSDKKLTVSKSITKKPLLKLIGVTNDLSNAKLEEALFKQNAKLLKDVEKEKTKIKVLRRIKGRTSAVNNIIMEVSPNVWKAFKGQKVHVGYQIVPAIDQSPVIQCYRCMGFGHRAKECVADKQTCGYCAEDHDSRECLRSNGAPSCVNCVRNKIKGDYCHTAYSADCPIWQKWDRIARSLVAYCFFFFF